MDWTQIEKDFHKYNEEELCAYRNYIARGSATLNWFKQRIERELPPQPPEKLNEEEKNEFYTTNVTAEIKPKYGN